jgi:hypothetical protein
MAVVSVILRLIALILVTIALMLLGADLVTTLETGKFTTRTLADVWTLIDKNQPAIFFAWCDHHLPALLAGGTKTFFALWGWAVTGPIGCLLLLIFGRRPGS